MTQIFARSALVLFATSALGACATPNYPVSLAVAASSAGSPAAAHEPGVLLVRGADDGRARAIPALDRSDLGPPRLLLAAHHRRGPAPAQGRQAADDDADPPATYKVKSGDTLEKIADKLGVTIAELKTANHLKGSAIRPGQELEVPGAAPKSKGRPARTARAEPAEPTTYKVKRGDTLYSISRRLGVSVEDLQDANRLSDAAEIHAGQTLKLPGAEPAAEEEAPPRSKARASRRRAAAEETAVEESGRGAAGRVVEVEGPPTTYRVRKGDTLEWVADELDTDIASLKKDNRLRGSLIHPGQVLKGPPSTSKAYVARSGDSLSDIALRFGVTAASLRKLNGLGRGEEIRGGQKIILPAGYRDHGPIAAPPRVPEERPAIRYTPRPLPAAPPVGEEAARPTTPSIGPSSPAPQPYSPPATTPRPYAPTPTTTPPASPGPQPYAPLATTPRPYTPTPSTPPASPGPQPYAPPVTTPRPYVPTPTLRPTSPGPQPYAPPTTAPRPYAPITPGGPPLAPQAAPPPTDAQISELGRGRFLWPLKGQILSDFGPKSPGQRNDGVNIQAAGAAAVRAAAAGDIVYAGDQVPGFGNLVLIKHADGWVTAYGHLSRVEVKMQQKVSQGQEIGEAGTTGGVSEPQLHFEVRYAPNPLERARPIDPKLVLPK